MIRQQKKSDIRHGLILDLEYRGAVAAGGIVMDLSGHGDSGVLYGNANFTRSGIALDGNGDYLKIPHNDIFNFGSDDFAVCAWVKLNNPSIYQHLLGTDTSGYLMIAFNYPSAGISVGRHNVAWDFSAPHSFDADYNHIAIIKNNAYIFAYVNGQLIGSASNIESYNTTDLYFGTHPGSSYVNGIVDDIHIYDRALSLSEIQFLYHRGTWRLAA